MLTKRFSCGNICEHLRDRGHQGEGGRSHPAAGERRKKIRKKAKKCLTKRIEYDTIFKRSKESTKRRTKKTSEKKSKKYLTRANESDIITEHSGKSTRETTDLEN